MKDFFSLSSQETCWMFITALEWQHQPSLSATPALQICHKSKGKSLVPVTVFYEISNVKTFTLNASKILNCVMRSFFNIAF